MCQVYVVEKTGARENAVVAVWTFRPWTRTTAALAGFLGTAAGPLSPTCPQGFTKIAIHLNERVTTDEHNGSYRAGTRATAVLADFLRQEGFTLLDMTSAPAQNTREWLVSQAKQDPSYYYFDVTGDISVDCTGGQSLPSYGGGNSQVTGVAANVRITVYNATADAVVDEFTGQSMGAGRPGANLRGMGPSLEQACRTSTRRLGLADRVPGPGLAHAQVFATEREATTSARDYRPDAGGDRITNLDRRSHVDNV